MCIKIQVYSLIGVICLVIIQVGNIPSSILPLIFLFCLFEGNILDGDVKSLSWENMGNLGVFNR